MMGYLTNEVGIDGMLVAPGYQYSQIDPNLTMTRAEHEEKFRAIRAAVRKSGFRWLASPVYQDFLTGERELPCTPWGSVTRNPYGWKGPCYLLTDAIFPTYEGAHRRHGVGALRPGERSAVRALRDPLRVRALGDAGGDRKPQGDRAEPRMDAPLTDTEPITPACCSQSKSGRPEEAAPRQSSGSAWAHRGRPCREARELRARRRARARAPEGTVLTATRVVAEDGSVLWEGDALPVEGRHRPCSAAPPGGRRAAERAELARRNGRDLLSIWRAVRWLPAAGSRAVRAVSDLARPSGRAPVGGPRDPTVASTWGTVVRALVTEPRRAVRASRAARRALSALERAAASIAAAGAA